jgi:Immunoglobulin domain
VRDSRHGRLRFQPRLLVTLMSSVILFPAIGCSRVVCDLPPSITGQPSNQTVSPGEAAVFTVAAFGSAPLTYQWFRNGSPIAGATQASYVTAASSTSDSGSSFSVTVTNLLGNLTSSSATLTVDSATLKNVRFVAPNGDDAAPGTLDQPYQTIQKCASTVTAGWTCAVRAGTYRETVTPNSGVEITSYRFEPVIVDGSDPVTGWTLFRGSVFKAHVHLADDDTNQVFVGKEMMTEARWPNGGDLFKVNWSVADSGTGAYQIVDPKLPALGWTGAKIHLWSGTDPFGNQTGVVTASSPGHLSIDLGQTGTCSAICPAKGGFYYLFGVLNALDTEKEWIYDPKTETLYFQAPGGVDPSRLDVRAKQRPYAFDLRGRTGVTIRNLTIFSSTIITDETSSMNTLDRIDAQYVSHFTTLPPAPSDPGGSNFSILNVHLGDSGIILKGTGNTLENSTIAYSAGAGVAIQGSGNIVRNNLIHDIDYIGDYDSGVDLIGNGNTIQQNTIYTVGRQAILVIGVLNQDVGYNNLSNSMLLSRDGGEIYACCSQIASGTRIHHNWIHDTPLSFRGLGDDEPISGIYIDNGSDGFNVDQNVLWHNRRFNVLINGYSNTGPNTNNIHNNTVPDDGSEAMISLRNVEDCTSTQIVDNRIVSDIKIEKTALTCNGTGNSRNAAGANEMVSSPQVGCNFSGCSTEGPPAILDSGYLTPCPVRVF